MLNNTCGAIKIPPRKTNMIFVKVITALCVCVCVCVGQHSTITLELSHCWDGLIGLSVKLCLRSLDYKPYGLIWKVS